MIVQLKQHYCKHSPLKQPMQLMQSYRFITNVVIGVCISISCTLFISQEVQAFKFTNKVCEEYGLGKNWYCQEDEHQGNTLTANDILDSTLPPEQKAIKLNELWEQQRKVAVITGKEEDITNFLITQRVIAAHGVDFARKIQHLIDTKPEFSASESYYKSISDEAIKAAEKQTILQSSNKRYALAFVYNSSCSHCVRQLPIIQKFKSVYRFKTLGVTVDNSFFEGLDENIIDAHVFGDPNVQAIPTILLLDKHRPERIFISKGLITLDELESRIANRIMEREDEKTS